MKGFSQNSYAICDLGLSIIKRLAPKDYEVQGLTALASLPAMMYKTPERKEGDDSLVSYIVLQKIFSCFVLCLTHWKK